MSKSEQIKPPIDAGPNEKYEQAIKRIGPLLAGKLSLKTQLRRDLFDELQRWNIRLQYLAQRHLGRESLTIEQLANLPASGPVGGDNPQVARNYFAAMLLRAIADRNSRPFEIIAEFLRAWAKAPLQPKFPFAYAVAPAPNPLKFAVQMVGADLGGLEKPISIEVLREGVSTKLADVPDDRTLRRAAKDVGITIKSPRGRPRKTIRTKNR